MWCTSKIHRRIPLDDNLGIPNVIMFQLHVGEYAPIIITLKGITNPIGLTTLYPVSCV